MAKAAAQVLFDEFGQPFIVVRDQEKQKRLTGIEALKVVFVVTYGLWGRGEGLRTLVILELFACL